MKPILLHITTVPETLGFLAGQIRFMSAKGFEVHALTSPGKIWTAPWVEDEFTQVYHVVMHRDMTPLSDAASLLKIFLLIKRLKPHIVHAHTPKAGLLGMIAARMVNVPVRIYHVHGSPFMTASPWKKQVLLRTERLSCLLASEVLCVSDSLRRLFLDEKLCPESKIQVLLGGSINGVDADFQFNPSFFNKERRCQIRRMLGIPVDALILGFVGRIVGDKGVKELTVAWRNLKQEFSNIHLLIVGPFESRDAIEPETKSYLENEPSIHLTGKATNMPELYASMDVMALPSYREGLPYAPIEAAAMELPVVSTLVPGCVDAVQHSITGTLVPAHDATALAVAVCRYFADPGLRAKHGKAGRKRVLRDFRQENIWEATYSTYRDLLSCL